MLGTGPIKAFQDSVLMILDDYREYLLYDFNKDEFVFNEHLFFQMKGVLGSSDTNNNGVKGDKYVSNENEFYHEFRVTQAFEEFKSDRCLYLKNEEACRLNNRPFQKDFIDFLLDQFKDDNPKPISKLLVFLIFTF